jgi:hypothetical protein
MIQMGTDEYFRFPFRFGWGNLIEKFPGGIEASWNFEQAARFE